MTRKEYAKIAAVIQRARAATYGGDPLAVSTIKLLTTDIAHDLCGVFSEDNPRFRALTFLMACGIDP